jgi:hypothetical protein
MAIMGRKKKAVARGWEAINKQRDEESKKLKTESEKKEEVTPEEHEKRLKLLKDLGLV